MNKKGNRKTNANRKNVEDQKQRQKIPTLQEFIEARDYTGAVTLLNFQLQSGQADDLTLPWLGFAYFHKGDHENALAIYNQILEQKNADTINHLYAACCHFYLGDLEKAEEVALMGPATDLQTRIRFHTAQKRGTASSSQFVHLQQAMEKKEGHEDQLSLASMHYLKSRFQEATDIYKRLLLEQRDFLALQVYVALCYYKLDYYDVSNEILAPYLSKYPTSIIAVNLKAANQFRLYEGKAAEAELKELMELLSASSQNVENDLIRHNLVVFRRGENALQVLPPLVDIILEARLNLVIYHLRQDNIEQAFNLMVEVNPVTPAEYILKGVVNAAMGQMDESKRQCIDDAQQFFQLIGASASECDTIPGRQCMASCFFLMKQFEDVLIYLNSIKSYSTGSDCPEEKVDIFNYNFGICQAAVGDYREGEEALLLVSDERIRNEYCYISWLARCYIMNNKAQQAWELQSTLDNNSGDTFSFFHLIANECYKSGAFYYSAKAFDMLDRLDPSTEYWEGKRGACCGVFQQVVAEKEDKEVLREIIQILRNTQQLSPQAELIVRIMIKWGNENGVVGLG